MDVAVYNYLKTVADGSVQAGISTGTLKNGGVGLAPFHDWDSKIPADLKAQIQKAATGSRMVPLRLTYLSEVKYLLSTGYSTRFYNSIQGQRYDTAEFV